MVARDVAPIRTGFLARFGSAIRHAMPSWKVALPGAFLWAAIMATSAATNLMADGWQSDTRIRDVVVVFAVGGFVGFPVGLTAAALVTRQRRAEGRFAAAFLGLLIATIAATTAVYTLEYRVYYAQWHADMFSMTWAIQFLFTTLGATFQFAVSGIRLYFPIGFIALALAALWFARRPC